MEVREAFSVEEVLQDGGVVTGVRGRTQAGATISEHALIVIGADGRHSSVAKAVKPQQYRDKPPLESIYYTYRSDLPVEAFFAPDNVGGIIAAASA